MSEHTEAVKSNLGDAGAHLKQAASAAGGAIKSAAGAAGDELRVGKAQVKSELADGAVAGLGAAEHPVSYTHLDVYKRQDAHPRAELDRRAAHRNPHRR